jgi:regulatory protein
MKQLLMSSSNELIEEVESDPYSVATTIALSALGRRARSRGELFTLLKKRGATEEVANAVLFRLQEQGFVNDYEFARYWSESRQRTKKLARRIIISELRSKGISDEIIEWITSDISDETEFENAMKFAERKANSYQRLEPEVAYRRLHGALVRRGFSGSVVSRVLGELGISRS